MPPHPAPIGRLWKLWFLGSCSQKACPPPPPSHPPHEVLANRPSGHKVAASPQGSQPGGVTPNRHGQELEHPACGHSLHRGCCSVSTSFLSASTSLLCPQTPAGSRGTLCPLGAGEAGHRIEGCQEGERARRSGKERGPQQLYRVENGYPWRASKGR